MSRRTEKRRYGKYNKYDVVYADFGKNPHGIQGGIRPGIIISCDASNHDGAPQVSVVPLSSKLKDIPVHVILNPKDVSGFGLSKISDFMPEDAQTISKGCIRAKSGNKTNMSKTNPILSINLIPEDEIDEMEGYSEIIKENIDYDSLLLAHPYDKEMVEGIFNLILETVLSKNEEITIAGDVYPKNLVKSKFLKLNYSHVEYVINCLGKNTTKVRNIKSYLLASLFNAGSTISSYYRAEVNHDMPQFAG